MRYKLIIGSPNDGGIIQRIITAASEAGAGKIGNYSRCAVVYKVNATWKPDEGAAPYDGEVGKIDSHDCVLIETECDAGQAKAIYQAVKKVHPYEEPGMQFIKLEEIDFE